MLSTQNVRMASSFIGPDVYPGSFLVFVSITVASLFIHSYLHHFAHAVSIIAETTPENPRCSEIPQCPVGIAISAQPGPAKTPCLPVDNLSFVNSGSLISQGSRIRPFSDFEVVFGGSQQSGAGRVGVERQWTEVIIWEKHERDSLSFLKRLGLLL